MQRWISPDALTIHTLAADMNVYAYVSGRVIRDLDLLGLANERDWTDQQAAARMREVIARYQNLVVKVQNRTFSVRTPFHMGLPTKDRGGVVGDDVAARRASGGKATYSDMRIIAQRIANASKARSSAELQSTLNDLQVGSDCSGTSYHTIKAGRRIIANDRGSGGLDVHGRTKDNKQPTEGWRLVDLTEARTGDLIVLGKFGDDKTQRGTGHKLSVIGHDSSTVEGYMNVNGYRIGNAGDTVHHFEVASSWFLGKETGPAIRHLYYNQSTGQWFDAARLGNDVDPFRSDKPYRQYEIGGVYRNRAYDKSDNK